MDQTSELLESIDTRLKLISNLLLHGAMQGLNQTQKVHRMVDMGLSSSQIAEALGVPTSRIAPTVSKYKKKAELAAGTE